MIAIKFLSWICNQAKNSGKLDYCFHFFTFAWIQKEMTFFCAEKVVPKGSQKEIHDWDMVTCLCWCIETAIRRAFMTSLLVSFQREGAAAAGIAGYAR